MHTSTPQGYALVNQGSAQLDALARRAKLERVRDAALDMLVGIELSPTTSEGRKYLEAQAANASLGIDDLNRTFGLVVAHPAWTLLS